MNRTTITIPDTTLNQIEDLKKYYKELDGDEFKPNTSYIIRKAVNYLWREKTLPFYKKLTK